MLDNTEFDISSATMMPDFNWADMKDILIELIGPFKYP